MCNIAVKLISYEVPIKQHHQIAALVDYKNAQLKMNMPQLFATKHTEIDFSKLRYLNARDKKRLKKTHTHNNNNNNKNKKKTKTKKRRKNRIQQ